MAAGAARTHLGYILVVGSPAASVRRPVACFSVEDVVANTHAVDTARLPAVDTQAVGGFLVAAGCTPAGVAPAPGFGLVASWGFPSRLP